MTIDKLGIIVHLLEFVELCLFPENWRGRFIDSSGGGFEGVLVEITNDSISNRGTCVLQQNEYFLFYNSDIYCYRCMELFHEHENVILYRQTSCVHIRKFSRSLCTRISHRSRSDLLLRERPSPTLCPFEKSMKFTYTDQTLGYCRFPNSSLVLNADRTRFRLKFKHCVEFASLNGKEIDFTCIAQWKEGSDGALLVQFITGLEDNEHVNSIIKTENNLDDFRCMKFSHKKDLMHVSLSSYWGCEGMWNSTKGPMVLEMSKDFYGWPSTCCSFPDWLVGHTWQNMIGSLFFIARDKQTLDIHEKTKIVSTYRCLKVLDFFLHSMEYIYLSHSVHDWSANLQCLKLQRKSTNVATFAQGQVIQVGDDSLCYENEQQYLTNEIIIVDQQGSPTECPERNFYHTPPVNGCVHRVDLGCILATVAHFEPLCTGPFYKYTLLCVGSWPVSDNLLIIAKDFLSKDYFCFILMNSSRLVTASRVDCGELKDSNHDVLDFLPSYNLIRNESCDDPMSYIYRERVLKWSSAGLRRPPYPPYGTRRRKSFLKDPKSLNKHRHISKSVTLKTDQMFPLDTPNNYGNLYFPLVTPVQSHQLNFSLRGRHLSLIPQNLNLQWPLVMEDHMALLEKGTGDCSEVQEPIEAARVRFSHLGDYDRLDHPIYIFAPTVSDSVISKTSVVLIIFFNLNVIINFLQYVILHTY